jgi:hypothetical protein
VFYLEKISDLGLDSFSLGEGGKRTLKCPESGGIAREAEQTE